MDNTDVFTFCADQADFWCADAVIDTWASVALWRRIMRSAGYGFLPSIISRFREANYMRVCADSSGYSAVLRQISNLSPLLCCIQTCISGSSKRGHHMGDDKDMGESP